MQINIIRKSKDKEQMLKKYFEDLQNAVTFHGDIDIMARHVLYLCNGGTHGEANETNSDISHIIAYPESHEDGVMLLDNELREIYEVLNAEGFRWEK